jgi:hypothetical protein
LISYFEGRTDGFYGQSDEKNIWTQETGNKRRLEIIT